MKTTSQAFSGGVGAMLTLLENNPKLINPFKTIKKQSPFGAELERLLRCIMSNGKIFKLF